MMDGRSRRSIGKNTVLFLLLCLSLSISGIPVYAENVTIEFGEPERWVNDHSARGIMLEPTVTPSDAQVSYKSENEKVAIISSEDRVVPTGYGSTVITATAIKGNQSANAECTIHVVCTDFSIAENGNAVDKISIPKDKNYQVSLKCPRDLDGTPLLEIIDWSSGNNSIFTVDKKGVITPKAKGTATLTAKLKKENNYDTLNGDITKFVTVNVFSNVLSIATDKESYEGYAGETVQIQAAALPEDADDRELLYSSDNKEFSVDSTGKVTLSTKASGTANITITAKDIGTVKKVVTVKAVDVIESIKPSEERVVAIPGDSFQLSPVIVPKVEDGVSFTSSSNNVTVDAKGLVKISEKISKDEEAVITIKAKDTHSTAQAKVVIDIRTDVSGEIYKVDEGASIEYEFRTNAGVSSANMIQIRNLDENIAKGEKIEKTSDGRYKLTVRGIKPGDTGIILTAIIDKDSSFYQFVNVSVQKAPEQKGPEQKAPEQKTPEQKTPVQKGLETKVVLDDVTYEIDGTDAVITSSELKKGKTTLKGSVTIAGKTYNVTKIKKGAFKKTKATNIVIPASIKEIGDSAFEGSSLTQVTIGKNVSKIGKKAFYNSKKLKKIIVKGKKIKKVGKKAFKKLSKNAKYKLPKGVKLP